jgi:hypothetical protein
MYQVFSLCQVYVKTMLRDHILIVLSQVSHKVEFVLSVLLLIPGAFGTCYTQILVVTYWIPLSNSSCQPKGF